MKIAGKVPGINRGEIVFYRGGHVLRMIVTAIPYGFRERIEREIPAPEPPIEFATDPKSGAVVRDEFGMALKTEKRSDPAFRRELDRVNALRLVAQAREALRSDHNVEFVADLAKMEPHSRAYYEQIEKEFAEAGFSDHEIIAIFRKALDLNSGAQQRVDAAAERFLSDARSALGGKFPNEPDEPSST